MSFRVVPSGSRGLRRLQAGALALVVLLAVLGGSPPVPPAHAANTSVSVQFPPFQNPADPGYPVQINAIVTCVGGGDPTGSVAFVDTTDGRNLGTEITSSAGPQAGQRTFWRWASFTYGSGDHTIAATYTSTNPACDSASDSSILTVPPGPTITKVTTQPTTAMVGQSVTLWASVLCVKTGSISGGVTFFDTTTGATLGTAQFTGAGRERSTSLTTTFARPGAHTITANFSGSNPLCGPSSGSATVTINPLPDTACAPRPRVVTQVVRNGDGRLRVTISASTNQGFSNAVQALTWTRLDNATVEVVGVGNAAQGQRTSLPAGTPSMTLLVGQVTPGRASTVSLVVADACGDWPTFVGGGPNAF